MKAEIVKSIADLDQSIINNDHNIFLAPIIKN